LGLIEWSRKNPKFSFAVGLFTFLVLKKCVSRYMRKPKSLKNQVILITGGGNGLGKLMALRCKQKHRAKVIVWDISEDSIAKIKDYVDLAMVCDVTIRDNVNACAEQIFKQFGAVNILINNAGIVSGKPLLDLSEKQIRKTFDVNIISHFWTVQAFLPEMLKRKTGHIVTIASSAGCVGVSHLTDYCGSKFAARGFDQALRRELIDLGFSNTVKQTIIHPYFINTGMFDGTAASKAGMVAFFTGSEFLDAHYVADEVISAIQYEKRELVLPYRMGKIFLLEHALPHSIQDWMILRASDMRSFKGHEKPSP